MELKKLISPKLIKIIKISHIARSGVYGGFSIILSLYFKFFIGASLFTVVGIESSSSVRPSGSFVKQFYNFWNFRRAFIFGRYTQPTFSRGYRKRMSLLNVEHIICVHSSSG